MLQQRGATAAQGSRRGLVPWEATRGPGKPPPAPAPALWCIYREKSSLARVPGTPAQGWRGRALPRGQGHLYQHVVGAVPGKEASRLIRGHRASPVAEGRRSAGGVKGGQPQQHPQRTWGPCPRSLSTPSSNTSSSWPWHRLWAQHPQRGHQPDLSGLRLGGHRQARGAGSQVHMARWASWRRSTRGPEGNRRGSRFPGTPREPGCCRGVVGPRIPGSVLRTGEGRAQSQWTGLWPLPCTSEHTCSPAHSSPTWTPRATLWAWCR